MVDYYMDTCQMGQEYGLKQYLMENETLDHVTKVIAYHPRYLEHYLKTQNFILNCDGPLSEPVRHYLALIATARHKCAYLINLHEKEFLRVRGDPNWLRGLDHIPAKLRAIYDMNKILAHRPWLLNKEHIERLTKQQPHNWSLSEVVHAIVLLAHFHSLTSFVFSCGLTQELDTTSQTYVDKFNTIVNREKRITNGIHHRQNSSPPSSSPPQSPSPPTTTGRCSSAAAAVKPCSRHKCRQMILRVLSSSSSYSFFYSTDSGKPITTVDVLMEKMKVLSERCDECSETELSNRFKCVEMQAAELPAALPDSGIEMPPKVCQYTDDPTFTYEDFTRRGCENVPTTFRVQDYSWEDHGLPLVSQLYNDVGYLLDDKFRNAYNLTYYTIADRRNVDTSKFRRAIWNYIQCIYGIRHDDYDYGEVNQLLDRQLKMFIKTACCFPERITKKDYDSVLTELQHSEKVHVNLLIMEARNQVELLYALREIMRYMT